MPAIVIKSYTWRQTSEFVILNIPLRGNPTNVDLFVVDNYLKVSFPPFIVELFLWAEIIEKGSNCVIADQEAILSLQKTEVGKEWPTLEVENIDKDTKRKYRNQALDRAQAKAEELEKIRKEKRQHLQREAVKEQININTATLNKIDAIRNAHRKEAMLELEDWRSKAEVPFLPEVEGAVQENRKAYKPPLNWFKDDSDRLKSRALTDDVIMSTATITEVIEDETPELEEASSNSNEKKNVDDGKIVERKQENENIDGKNKQETTDDSSSSEDSDDNDESKSVELRKKKNPRPGWESVQAAINGKLIKRNSIFDEPSKSVPFPRKKGTISVTFSDRKFPTPARESSHLEEQEWLEKQAEARRKVGFDSADLRPEERDPLWLKNKGDEFFKVGNHLAAISAYTYGIKISDKFASLYVNRSAAHYALGNYCRCVEDCSKALELMEPKCESNLESRVRCHARRGAALCKLSSPQHGIPELEAALKLAPDNESIKRDVLAAKQYFDLKD
ncbi:dynein axonemal assembly factor 4 [Lasioglossum baleicum]|uniref:dynein axonemal assembly factor 4 n=1 Tax=Lasioglossum baleicum TaxID=434251 RepID=UPI003FCDA04A